MQLEDYVEKYNTLKSIKRFNMETVSDPQDLCGHGYGVGTLFYLLCQMENVEISTGELFMVMNHDFTETYTGDINDKVKTNSEETKKAWEVIEKVSVPKHLLHLTDSSFKLHFNKEKLNLLKLADRLDALMYCTREVQKGNKFLEKARKIYLDRVLDSVLTLKSRDKIHDVLQHLFVEVRK